jgi:allantoinase
MTTTDRYDIVFRADRVVLPDGERPAAVAVLAGRVAAIAARDAPMGTDHTVELAGDEVLIPGLVDSHVHVNEPGRTEWEGFATATRAARAGGITTIIDMPLNSLPPTVDAPSLAAKLQAAAGQCYADVGFWGGAIPGNAGELHGLHDAGVFGFKCFLADSGVPEFPPLDAAQLTEHLRVVAELDALMVVHAEDGAVLAGAPAPSGGEFADFVASRPPAAEDAAVTTLLEAAGRTGARVHVLHLSSASALPLLSRARADGVAVSVETCPHYLTLDAAAVPPGATQFKCCPPIRDAANADALWAALAAGEIDAVVSDHSPCVPELKRFDQGDFALAWGGIASVQLALAVTWTAARRRGFTLPDVVGWMSAGPARVVGLHRKGGLRVGADADLAVLAPDEPFVVEEAALHHRHPVTPYAGQELTGVVRRTWLRGRAMDGVGPPGAATGSFLMRGEA